MSLSDEIEAWLADDVTGHVEHIAEIARLARREAHYWDKLTIARPPGDQYPYRVAIECCEPQHLRAVADAHEVAATELLADAAELRDYAEDIEGGDGRGAQLTDHFRVMREGRAEREAARECAWQVARAEGGVIARFGDLGFTLVHGGLLTVEDVCDALAKGRLLRVKGIGPARFSRIVGELRVNESGEPEVT